MAELHEYQCPACGGALAFDIDLQKLKCPFCESIYDISELDAAGDMTMEPSATPVRDGAEEWTDEEKSGFSTYVCQSCAGEIIADTTTGATTCPYCDNPVVVKGHFQGSLRPDSIIPFKLKKDKAISALQNHYRGKFLLPKAFKDKNKLNEIKGIYVPFWLYSGHADADLEFRGEKTRTWSDSEYKYTETSVYSLYREGSIDFSSVPVDASSKMQDELMDSLEPYQLSEAVDFNTAYMAGYLADKFDEDEDKCFERADTRVRNSTVEALKNTIKGYGNVSLRRGSVDFKSDAKYMLLPVWLLITSWNDTKYTFAMNGQTGKLVGELPIDKKKARLVFAGITAVLFAIVTTLYFLKQGGVI